MPNQPTYINSLPLAQLPSDSQGDFVQIGDHEYYRISNYDHIRPSFISLVSHSDHWMFISTTGGLSTGRKDAESSLFPYYTDDKISDDSEITGSKTILRIKRGDKTVVWEPFSVRYNGAYKRRRNLYKRRAGDRLIFEEINEDLGLTFQYSWGFSDKYGFVKESKLSNNTDQEVEVEVVDGIQNILPYGVSAALQSSGSNLVNAYKKNELDADSGLGMFMLSAIIVDKAEPSEALKTTTVWSTGVNRDKILLSSLQLDAFRNGSSVQHEEDIRAERGAYFVNSTFTVSANKSSEWMIVAEVNQDHSDVIQLIEKLSDGDVLRQEVAEDVEKGRLKLIQLVGKSDGLQLCNDKLVNGRHYANVLFNIMRGGIFDEDYNVDKNDFLSYVKGTNFKLIDNQKPFFNELKDEFDYQSLIEAAQKTNDTDLIRICYEYLPLTFSRRHGDPSRPWNKFTIAIRDEEGKKLRQYEGNWRDIFQNWEALAVSYPGFILSMITKFVNASTIDGYNPYRITRDGIDWEEIEPDNPWSYIGYWGDHQIIYLQKLLEIAISHQPKELKELLEAQQFVYANVPYRIKGYESISHDPQDTIEYDHIVEKEIGEKVNEYGADGKLVFSNDKLLKANLTEKLLVSFLAKMSNFIPEGGIWLNTQRPEWNDANNALVGNGVSMVTLYYMRRFASSMITLFNDSSSEIAVNHSVGSLFRGIHEVLDSNKYLLQNRISNTDRKKVVDRLGRLGESYRSVAYKGFISTTDQLSSDQIQTFFEIALEHIDHSIRANKREDGLYHAYNLLSFEGEEAKIDHLYEMLEGQVAVLSAGLLDMNETLEVLDALKSSDIYREDQYSYMLYPNRTLPKFLEKNTIPQTFIESSALAKKLLEMNDKSLIYKDVKGNYHFNGSFNNAGSLDSTFEKLKKTDLIDLADFEQDSYLAVFEEMFNHKAFTGRSGTFYGYEGLGSIYWHMVSKLLVSVQENIYAQWDEFKGTQVMGRVIDHYYEIRAGIGINKSPELYGSFPTDPYSHTPGGKGVQQPGMTGQVKEDILNRWAVLGVFVKDGCIHFDPKFLSSDEYLDEQASFEFFDLSGNISKVDMEKDQLAFTYCQVPIIYKKGDATSIEIHDKSGSSKIDGSTLDANASNELFQRTGSINKIIITHQFQ
ncbi:MAG: hypothetical protein AB8B73_06010 [Ekhidna sp.]